MKKVIFIAISVLFAFNAAAANLNPFAYDLKTLSYDANTYTLSLQYKLNAPAKFIKIYAKDSNKQRYLMKTYSSGSDEVKKGTRNITINLLECEESIPRGEYLTWEIDAISTHQTDVACGRKITLYTPFSIDIDNNPESPYFGRIVTSQANNTSVADDVGLYVYDPAFNLQGTYKDPELSWSTGDWYSGTRLTPFRVRILQDGTGRIFTSAASYKRTTHLWIVNNNDLTDWDQVISNKEMISFTGHPSAENTLGNIGFDFKIDGNNLDILLFSGSTEGATDCPVGYVHSGVFHCTLNDPQTGTYTIITKDIEGARHTYVTSNKKTSIGPIGSFLNSNITYDQYGGIWYTHHSTSVNTTNPGLLHYINNSWKTDYDDGTTLERQNIGSGAIRYNKHFNRLAISQGSSSAVRLYDVSQQEKQHPTLSNGTNIAIISTKDTKYIIDLAWDYASNLYACIRNRDSNLYGVWTIATNLKGDPTTTPAPNKNENRIFLECNDTQYNITINAQVDNNSINTNLGACALKVDNISANWGTKKSVQACEQITVTAVTESRYKFLGWKKDGNLVSTDLTYSFYVTQETNLMAMFDYAVYNVEWYNLFQNKEDITDSSLDAERNARLWRLFQVEYNKYANTNTNQPDFGESKGTSGSNRLMYYVLKFVNTNFGEYDSTSKRCDLIENFLDKDSDPSNLYWLGQYIESVVGREDINKHVNGQLTTNIWGFYLQSFINRTISSHNQSFEKATGVGNVIDGDYKVVDFSEKSKPIYWRPYWTSIACELPNTYSYGDELPKDWNWYELPVGKEIADAANSSKKYNPCATWCKWNNQAANPNKLLAWYYDDKNNPTWPANPTIVRNVYKDGALFATWVDKTISEDEDKQQKNSDVIYLLNHHNGTHNIEVDRTLQANMYNTFCLPFGVNAKSQLPSELQDATFVKFDRVDKLYDSSGDEVAVLNFSEVTFSGADTLEAGKPYLVLPKTDISTSKVYTNIKTDYKNGDNNNPTVVERAKTVTQETANGGHVSFCGTINSVSIPEQTVILVADSRLAKTTEAGNMLGLRGYFIVDDPYIQSLADEGKLYLSMKKPVTTSIPVAPEAEQQTKPEVRKVMYDGKIYILRGDGVYTITGHRVR